MRVVTRNSKSSFTDCHALTQDSYTCTIKQCIACYYACVHGYEMRAPLQEFTFSIKSVSCSVKCITEKITSIMYSKGEVIFVICLFSFIFCCVSIPLIILYTTDDVTSDSNLSLLAKIRADNCVLQQVIKQHSQLITHSMNSSYDLA